VLYIDWRENSQSYFHILQALDVSPTCDAEYVKSIIQLFPHSSQHVTGNSSHSLSDAPLQIVDIRTLRYFRSIRTQIMDLASVVFCKINFWKCILLLEYPVLRSWARIPTRRTYLSAFTTENYKIASVSFAVFFCPSACNKLRNCERFIMKFGFGEFY
jgi:hypothetical protein